MNVRSCMKGKKVGKEHQDLQNISLLGIHHLTAISMSNQSNNKSGSVIGLS